MCRAIPVARQDLPGSRDADRRNSPGSPLAPWLQCHRADDEQECRIMSISALASTPWSPPTPSSTDAGAASAINWPSPQWTTGSITQGTNDLVQSGTASASNPFQQLSGDIQALLVQAQSGSGTTTAPTTATATPTTLTPTTLTPTQQLAADVQTILSELQGSGSSGATATQAGTPQASAAGQAQPHHHHHHHESGADTTSATAATGTATSTGTTPAAPSSSSASSADAAVSNVFAADIVQALQSYGSTSSSASSIGLTA
jgi:hypothetical protein